MMAVFRRTLSSLPLFDRFRSTDTLSMTTFIALVIVMVFLHVVTTTYIRHGRSQSVRDLWDSPYRYNWFRES